MPEAAEAVIGHNRATLTEILSEKYADLAKKVEAIAVRANTAPRKIETDDHLATIGKLVVDTRALFKDADKAREAEKEPFLKGGREVDAFFSVFKDRLDRIGRAFQQISDDHARAVAAKRRAEAEAAAKAAREEAERQAEIARRAEEANRTKTAEKHGARAGEAERAAEAAEAVASSSAADLVRERLDTGVLSTARTEWTFEITDYAAIPLDILRPYMKREHVEQAIRALVKIQKNATSVPGVRIFEDTKASFR